MQTNQEIEEEIILLKSEIASVMLSDDYFAGFVRINQKISALGKILAARTEADDALDRGEKTGAPGRPTSMHLVDVEAERRRKTGQAALPVSDEAKALHSWIKSTHPAAPPPTPKTIENRIREDHRAWSKPRK